jgi:hypothetical protein
MLLIPLLVCLYVFAMTATPPPMWVRVVLTAAAFGVPLLVFETLVYIGMRKMRYANTPGSERELADNGDTPHPAAAQPPSPARGEGAGVGGGGATSG